MPSTCCLLLSTNSLNSDTIRCRHRVPEDMNENTCVNFAILMLDYLQSSNQVSIYLLELSHKLEVKTLIIVTLARVVTTANNSFFIKYFLVMQL